MMMLKSMFKGKVRFPTKKGYHWIKQFVFSLKMPEIILEFYTWMPQEALYVGSQIKKDNFFYTL